ncbi:hypothetical protein BKH43_01725 [Helicobacter sp. 13S00401-1]|nr:hypothetical protein BKH43_01725 [Helicobacter sp. 13S00401-1]
MRPHDFSRKLRFQGSFAFKETSLSRKLRFARNRNEPRPSPWLTPKKAFLKESPSCYKQLVLVSKKLTLSQALWELRRG